MRMNKQKVEKLFEGAEHQGDVLLGLYQMIIPRWDEVEKIEHWPSVNSKTWHEIASLFQQFDREHHPEVLPGGAWMNSGFSSTDDESVDDWQVDLSSCEIKYQERGHWPQYFWFVEYYPRLPDGEKRIRERSGYSETPEGALSSLERYAHPVYTSSVGVQKQWGDHENPPLLSWTVGMQTPEHFTRITSSG